MENEKDLLVGNLLKNKGASTVRILHKNHSDGVAIGLDFENHFDYEAFIKNLEGKKKVARVIYNAPATIVIDTEGKKYVSKAHEEVFDAEKGLLMCLAKMHGYTHTEIKRMIDGAKVQKPSPEEICDMCGVNIFSEIDRLAKAFVEGFHQALASQGEKVQENDEKKKTA